MSMKELIRTNFKVAKTRFSIIINIGKREIIAHSDQLFDYF